MEWGRFIRGELFVRCASYHNDDVDPLVDVDEIFSLLQKDYTEYWSDTKPSFYMVKWIYSCFSKEMLDPECEPQYGGLSFRDAYDSWWITNSPPELKDFISEHPDTLDDLLDWVALMETPFSYEMIRILSNDFTMEYDDYESISPYEERDATKMNQWGMYFLYGPDYPNPPAMKCRAIWYA